MNPKTEKCPKCLNRKLINENCINCEVLQDATIKKNKKIFLSIIAILVVAFVGLSFILPVSASDLQGTMGYEGATAVAELTPTLNPSDLPKKIKYIVETCEVKGEESNKVEAFKAEMREVNNNWLTQFQSDDGTFIQDKFPLFNDKTFLLFCMPKEIGPNWMTLYGDKFFTAIGTNPIDEKTGKENKETIAKGYWLFYKQDKKINEGSNGTSSSSTPNVISPTATMYFTDTPAPTLPPPTLTPIVLVANVTNNYTYIELDDLIYDRGDGAVAWQQCLSKSFSFRSKGNGYMEAACPDFYTPTVHIDTVGNLGEGYSVYSSDGTGSWFARSGIMNYGNTGLNYSWTNSLGIQYYSMGIGNVSVSPVQLVAPTQTPQPTLQPNVIPTNTSFKSSLGCYVIGWEKLKSDPLAIVNEIGDPVLLFQPDRTWKGSNTNQCYEISGYPIVVINLDTGAMGTWNLKSGSTISLGWLDPAFKDYPFIWRISNNIWVGNVDP